LKAPDLRRRGLMEELLLRARSGKPVLLAGPPGAGKTTTLRALGAELAREGWVPVYLDLMGAASSPDRFAIAALSALPAERFGKHLARATEIRRLAGSGKDRGADAVHALFGLWSSLDDASGRPVALLLDEVTEIRSLAYFAGLRQVDKPFAAALAARRRGTILATSYPTLARSLWPPLEAIEAGPLTADDLTAAAKAARVDPEALARASFGWPRYARILLEAADAGGGLETAWAAEMAEGGRLEAACRHTYESLLLRSRGYGMSKAVLAAVAHEEGLNLTALVSRVGRTPGAVRDYLGWLLGVDALRTAKKRYVYVDGMVRWWVRLHGRGTPASEAEVRAAAQEVAGGRETALPEAEPARPPARREDLVEDLL
jgi:energy-coupling factor transporter ATP-binding protein EcfA2